MELDNLIWLGVLCIAVGLSLPQGKRSGGIVRRRTEVGGQQVVISDQRSAPSAAVQAVAVQHIAEHPVNRDRFLCLFDHRLDSIREQDEYYAYLAKAGVLSSNGQTMTDEAARDWMQQILEYPTTDRKKDAALEVLSIELGNKGGLASPVLNEISAKQYELIKKYQAQRSNR